MIQIINCKNCFKSDIGFGNIYVDLTFKKNTLCCDKCNNIKSVSQGMYFCSIYCFKDYVTNNEIADIEQELFIN